jgi:transcriptional antiterminator NusG
MPYYAIQVVTAREIDYIKRLSLTREDLRMHNIRKKLMIRLRGKPIMRTSTVFPGYVFLDYIDDTLSPYIVDILRKTRYFIRVLPSTSDIKPLCPRDAELIRRFITLGGELAPSLVTFDENQRIRIIKGALVGLEGNIVKVDRRKHRVKLRLNLNDSPFLIDLGFELLEKVQENAL